MLKGCLAEDGLSEEVSATGIPRKGVPLIDSDVILLNKTDLVSADKVSAIEQDIHLLQSGARILIGSLQSDFNLPLSAILEVELAESTLDSDSGFDRYSLSRYSLSRYSLSQRELTDRLVSDHFVSIPFQSDRPFDFTKFEYFLRQQLPEAIFRAKGILWFDHQPQRYLFHLAGKRFELFPEATADTADSLSTDAFSDIQVPFNQSQLLLIGHKLNALQIHQQLINCLSG